MMKHPDVFRWKIKVSDEEIGQLEEIQDSSIIEPPRESIRIRNNTVSYSIWKMQPYLMSVNLDKLFGSDFFIILDLTLEEFLCIVTFYHILSIVTFYYNPY